MAYEVVVALGARLDVIVVKKVGAPFSRELALGAVCSDGISYLRYDAVNEFSIPLEYLDEELERRSVEAAAAEIDYREDSPTIDISGKRVIIVGDGVATGSTLGAAMESVRRRGAALVTVAVPAASV